MFRKIAFCIAAIAVYLSDALPQGKDMVPPPEGMSPFALPAYKPDGPPKALGIPPPSSVGTEHVPLPGIPGQTGVFEGNLNPNLRPDVRLVDDDNGMRIAEPGAVIENFPVCPNMDPVPNSYRPCRHICDLSVVETTEDDRSHPLQGRYIVPDRVIENSEKGGWSCPNIPPPN